MTNLAQATDLRIADPRIEDYLHRLDSALRGMPPAERQDILCEIRAHIVDSVAAAPNPEPAIDRVVRLLGSPEELAQHYSTERMFTKASESLSPWLLLRTSWHWARVGVRGMLAFFLALIGYGTALSFTFTVLMKVFKSPNVGMWWGHDDLVIGSPAHTDGMHELLGQWFAPAMIVAAFGLAVGTTHALRWLIRQRTNQPSR
jgi:uncharacterized membrane protein